MNDIYLHAEWFYSQDKEHNSYELQNDSNHYLVSGLWGWSIMMLIHPKHPPPAIFCVQIEHFTAAIREFNSICVSSCPLVQQEKTIFQKLKIAMTHSAMTVRYKKAQSNLTDLSWHSKSSVGRSTHPTNEEQRLSLKDQSLEATKMSTILDKISLIHLSETEV